MKPLQQHPTQDVMIGDIVVWHPPGASRDEPGYPAFVVAISQFGSLCVRILNTLDAAPLIRDGVLHISHPRARDPEYATDGFWSHHPRHAELANLRDRLQQVELLLNNLVEQLALVKEEA
ncbi:MAG TPA: hypothetical protein VNK04_03970 [Gemmataceae bacterium]|nr:hypothetical protein [Gemmataceae bacterium]